MADEKKDHLKDLEWMGRPIAEKDHVHGLDREAAVHEFGNKIPRHEAEEKAYEDYKKEQHGRAAAHHLQGMKAAHASGNMDEARKHGLLYDQHVKHLGHDSSIGPVPDSVSRYAAEEDKGPYKFKAHHGDRFVLDKSEDTMADLKKDTAFMGASELEKDHSLRNVVLGHSVPRDAPKTVPEVKETYEKKAEITPGSSPQMVGSQSAFGAKDKPVLKDEPKAGHQCQVCDSSTREATGKIGDQRACSLCISEHNKAKKSEDHATLHLLYKATKAILDGALKKNEGK